MTTSAQRLDEQSPFSSARHITRDVAELIHPPRRIRVSEHARESVRVVDGSGRVTPWSEETAPYIVEPMDCLSSRAYDAVIFVGPSRSGKTLGLVDAWIGYIVNCDPGDMLVVQITEDKAREYSKKRVDRMLRNSPELLPRMSPRGHDNNVHEKFFRAGNYLAIQWPSKNVLASSDFKYVALTDYDRPENNIGGEGDLFGLAAKRTQTFMSSGMTLAESSPGEPITDADWERPESEPHASPPASGVMSLYNQGDRRRWYWQCDDCRGWYMPVMENWHRESGRPVCPHCGCQPEAADKRRLNLGGQWVPEGCWLDEDGVLHGERRRSRIASFWMEGPAAAYQTWESLAANLTAAEEDFRRDGSQESLQRTINTDWGRPYLFRRSANQRSSARLQDRADSQSVRKVPEGVRFLTAAVDVQGGKERRFVVQIHGWGVGRECWVVDRFNIREDRDADPPRQVDPATRPEDWDVLTRDVLPRTYPLDDGSGREMGLVLVAVDTGGESGGAPDEGVTSQAYDWYRRIRRQRLHRKVMLVKGASTKTASRIRKSYPDNAGRKDRHSGAKGDVPVYLLGTDALKDAVAAMLDREEPGPAYLHTPNWLGRWFYEELSYEERGPDGKWRRPGKKPNEAFDLAAYNLAAFITCGGERIDWGSPKQLWAAPWDENPYLVAGEDAEAFAPPPVRRRRRRLHRSRYIQG